MIKEITQAIVLEKVVEVGLKGADVVEESYGLVGLSQAIQWLSSGRRGKVLSKPVIWMLWKMCEARSECVVSVLGLSQPSADSSFVETDLSVSNVSSVWPSAPSWSSSNIPSPRYSKVKRVKDSNIGALGVSNGSVPEQVPSVSPSTQIPADRFIREGVMVSFCYRGERFTVEAYSGLVEFTMDGVVVTGEGDFTQKEGPVVFDPRESEFLDDVEF